MNLIGAASFKSSLKEPLVNPVKNTTHILERTLDHDMRQLKKEGEKNPPKL